MMDDNEKWRAHADAFLHGVSLFATKYFGERCPDFDEGCACCRAWKAYDEFEAICR